MTKAEYLRLAESKWPELESLQTAGDFYAYERRFAEIMGELNLAILQGHLGAAPNDYRKKNLSKQPTGESK